MNFNDAISEEWIMQHILWNSLFILSIFMRSSSSLENVTKTLNNNWILVRNRIFMIDFSIQCLFERCIISKQRPCKSRFLNLLILANTFKNVCLFDVQEYWNKYTRKKFLLFFNLHLFWPISNKWRYTKHVCKHTRARAYEPFSAQID